MLDFLNSFGNYEFNFHTNAMINSDVITFVRLCSLRQYSKMSVFMECLHNKNRAFYTEDMYTTLFKIMSSIVRIRRFMVRNSKKNARDVKYINDLSLELIPLNKDCVELNINSIVYRFNTTNIIKLYKYFLHNIDDHYYLYGELTPMKNPYTNIPFSLKEHTLLYQYINNFYFKIRKSPPQYLSNFKQCYFNKVFYEKNYHSKLIFHSITSYLKKLDEERFNNEFMGVIHSSLFIKERYCYKCFKTINKRSTFMDSVRLYILNSNAIYKYGDYQDEFVKACGLAGIKLELNHYKRHRRTVKARRRRETPQRLSPIINNHPLAI